MLGLSLFQKLFKDKDVIIFCPYLLHHNQILGEIYFIENLTSRASKWIQI